MEPVKHDLKDMHDDKMISFFIIHKTEGSEESAMCKGELTPWNELTGSVNEQCWRCGSAIH